MNQSVKKVFYFPLTKVILGISCCLGILIGFQNVVSKPLIYFFFGKNEITDSCINYISVLVLCTTYFYFYKIYEKKTTHELNLRKFPKEFTTGLSLGFGCLSLVIGILYFLNYYEVIAFSNATFFLAPLSSLVIAALIEEVLFRLVFYRIFENWLGTYWALFILAFAFEIPHWANDNVTILSVVLGLLFGFAHGIMYTYTKRLWLPFAFHLGWNVAQPFYGSNLSGITDVGYVIKAKFSGPELVTGSIYGIEDSLISILLLLAISALFLYLSIKENKIIRKPSSKNN
ncbi:conserved membrane hypothetical protein [Flavobacterium sp. 9AF]|uniref:CPBP family intramembrane glutamic endopeptidase n=1 Tax=Flavobacterium sp. 9AF TaxID=2653142 RepID=UPI0012F39178|nr:CPBP family intramembrane glutamic endopeptidase [Flavobacterium sp. 9AF]VXB96579.1 conserved membrane hypothetical protein [Flavobacterium sp. 9AF]